MMDGFDSFTRALSEPTTPRTRRSTPRTECVWLVYQYNPVTDKYIVAAVYDNVAAAGKHMDADGGTHHQAYMVQSSFKGG